jgi:hypothetical protein
MWPLYKLFVLRYTVNTMNIFYDFETSSRDLLGQVLTYSFFLVDSDYAILEELSGSIRLNRTQIPEAGAILTNRINLDHLQANGMAEYEAAAEIYFFLNGIIGKHKQATLVGFNSNQFDLSFLRNMLIKYGLNPYFGGKLKNIDLLHYCQHLAFNNSHDFPWVRTEGENSTYYSFKLEDLTRAFSILDGPQSHDAREDVLLTIKLTRFLEVKYGLALKNFSPIQFPSHPEFQGEFEIFQQKDRHFAKENEDLKHYTSHTFVKLCLLGKSYLMVNLDKFQATLEDEDSSPEALLGCLRYINPNKSFFVLDPVTAEAYPHYEESVRQVYAHDFFTSILKKNSHYFDLIKKEQDIEYQIHELGFDRIDTLKRYVNTLIQDPSSYENSLKELLAKRKEPKDNYLIQLFNRVYLNTHPDPRADYLMRYMTPRYIDGSMTKYKNDFHSFSEQVEQVKNRLMEPDRSEHDLDLLGALLRYYETMIVLA